MYLVQNFNQINKLCLFDFSLLIFEIEVVISIIEWGSMDTLFEDLNIKLKYFENKRVETKFIPLYKYIHKGYVNMFIKKKFM